MDEETLAPMADALSATLAVIVLLICFFILGQVVAVSKQIDLKDVGAREYVHEPLLLDFETPEVQNGKLMFNQSFNVEQHLPVLIQYLSEAKAKCEECGVFKVISNYPQVGISLKRAKRSSLANAIKLIPTLGKLGMDYEIELTNSGNAFYLQVEGVRD